MRSFRLETPTTLDAALALLAEAPDRARPIAGGTALVPLWKERLLQFEILVDLGRVAELRGIGDADGGVRIGATTTLAEVEDSDPVRRRLPLLHEAVRLTANRRIREMATLGGALSQGDPASDVCAGALAAGAVVHVAGPGGRRSLPAADFFLGFYETALAPGEVVTHVTAPGFTPRHRHAYLRFSPRSRYDRPTVAVAVSWVEGDGGGCADVRVAFGNAGPAPLRCAPAEAALEGTRADDRDAERAAEAAHAALDPIADLRGSAEYKREMARVFLRRAIGRAKLAGPEQGVA
jgi:carbon-monoxide dehydrogenase medium subunit